jgi:hypothetical protein
MKNIILAATIALLTSASAFAAKPPRCNPAIQNWVNGSKTTCVFDSRGVDSRNVSVAEPPSIIDVDNSTDIVVVTEVPNDKPPADTGTPSENDNNVLK